MKRKLQLILSASAGSLLACAALAQYPISPELDQLDYTPDRPVYRPTGQLNGAAKASDLIGMTVKNYQEEKLGKVEDLAVDVESGRIVQVILSTGGFIGIGDTLTAVPPGALRHDVGQKLLHLNADKAKLKDAPKFEAAKWDESNQSNRLHDVYAYYDAEPYFGTVPPERSRTELTSVELQEVRALPRNLDGTINTDSPKTVQSTRNAELARLAGENYTTTAIRNPDGTWSREYYSNANGPNASGHSLGYIQKASQIIGTSVKTRQQEKLGDVNNLLVDLAAGRIVAVIISSGGFLGLGDELSAVPPTALRYSALQTSLELDTIKEQLSAAPHFQSNQWPDFNQPGYVGGVYRAYNLDPYFTSDATTDVDNTRRNIRDRNDWNVTPLDQGNSKADVATTAQIRREILATKNMSVNARNVKIITKDGQITLRGPVNTAAEKSLIAGIAERSSHFGKVNNQLEVKVSPKTKY